MKKYACLLAFVAAFVFALAGCDDVKTVKKADTIHESEPVMVSPGEEVIE